jgi:hypothetical protein
MTDFTNIRPIESSDKIAEYHQIIGRLLGTVYSEQELWIRKEKQWIAVVANDSSVGEEFDVRLVATLTAYGYSEVIAVAWENLLNFPHAFVIPTTLEAIEEFNGKFVLFAGKPDWLILLTRLDYLIIAGQPKFVREVLGCEPEQAFNGIQGMSESEYIDPVVRKYYAHLLKQLQALSTSKARNSS